MCGGGQVRVRSVDGWINMLDPSTSKSVLMSVEELEGQTEVDGGGSMGDQVSCPASEREREAAAELEQRREALHAVVCVCMCVRVFEWSAVRERVLA